MVAQAYPPRPTTVPEPSRARRTEGASAVWSVGSLLSWIPCGEFTVGSIKGMMAAWVVSWEP